MGIFYRKKPGLALTQKAIQRALFLHGEEGACFDINSVGLNDGRFFQDFNLTAADALGDPVRIMQDALSIGKQKVAFLNGVSGTLFTTPDRTGLDITGDIDLIAYIAMTDWTPSVDSGIISKWAATGNQRSYLFVVRSTGVLRVLTSPDGVGSGSQVVMDSTAAPSVLDGDGLWIRVKIDIDNGGGDADTTFYTSTDPKTTHPGSVSWTQLGAVVNPGSTLTIFNSSADVQIGAIDTTISTDGKCYRAAIYSGFSDAGGTLAADFDPTQYSGSGATLADGVSGNWTRNGQAFILPDGTHFVTPSDAARLQVAQVTKGGFRNLLTATATLSTQNVTTEAKAYTLSFKGTGTVTLSGTSTDGPLVGTGANDRVELTFTPSAGTLTLTVSGSVTEAQLEAGSAFTIYEAVGAGRYDISISGQPVVTWLYGAGSQYGSIFGSKNWTWMHDGTGGKFAGNFIVDKADDGANDYFVASSTAGIDVGFQLALLDSSTNDASLVQYITQGSLILNNQSSNNAIDRFVPAVVSMIYTTASSPNGIINVDRSLQASADDIGTPSSNASTYDIAIGGLPGGSNIMPHYLGSALFVDRNVPGRDFVFERAQQFLQRQAGYTG